MSPVGTRAHLGCGFVLGSVVIFGNSYFDILMWLRHVDDLARELDDTWLELTKDRTQLSAASDIN